jgi:hypothetical protein
MTGGVAGTGHEILSVTVTAQMAHANRRQESSAEWQCSHTTPNMHPLCSCPPWSFWTSQCGLECIGSSETMLAPTSSFKLSTTRCRLTTLLTYNSFLPLAPGLGLTRLESRLRLEPSLIWTKSLSDLWRSLQTNQKTDC